MNLRDTLSVGLLVSLLAAGAEVLAEAAPTLGEPELQSEADSTSLVRRVQPLDWLYEVEVPVAGRSTEAREQAAADALLVLLSRLSGLAEVPRNQTVESALQRAARYYSQFDYQTQQLRGQRQLLLHVIFDPAPVNQLMQQAELPLWGSRRRGVVAWLALDDGNLSLVSAQEPTLGAVLKARARERGIPLTLPSAADLRAGVITAEEVWSESEFTLSQAELLYEADLLVTGRLRERSDGLIGVVALKLGDVERQIRVSGIDRETAARRLVDQLVALLAEPQVVQPRPMDSVAFSVVGGERRRALRRALALPAEPGISAPRGPGRRTSRSL